MSEIEASSNMTTTEHKLEGADNNTAPQTSQERELIKRRKTQAMGFLRLLLIDMIIADVMKILDKWKNLSMTDGMTISVFMQNMYDLLNDMREINQLPSDIVAVHKILKIILAKFESICKGAAIREGYTNSGKSKKSLAHG
uniref:Uncharacterized protein n=1 Tax=Physcomitrium patens TaxID=3218 RepID=A0A2K1IU62_PHYPA|nr:hypothetical protein PHYPA_024754 [Physcomitrium patens]